MAYFVSFFFFNLLFVFSTRRTNYEYERIGKLDVRDVNDLWFRLKELRLSLTEDLFLVRLEINSSKLLKMRKIN